MTTASRAAHARATRTASTNPTNRRSKEDTMTVSTRTASPTVDWIALLAALSAPFHPSDVKYRAGAVARDKTKAQALPYADPRAYEDRLNATVPGDWSVEFAPWGEHRIICRLTIHGVTRSSTGEATNSPDNVAGTSAEAQAFKRACTKFGLGRYLYDLTPQWTDYDPTSRRVRAPAVHHQIRREDSTLTPSSASTPIGRERAERMHRELARIGLSRPEHAAFAARVLRRPVPALAVLTDREAREVWTRAEATTS